MKRTNLVLNEELLDEATRLSGERTYSGAVNRALLDYVRRAKAGRILELAGRGLWEGPPGLTLVDLDDEVTCLPVVQKVRSLQRRLPHRRLRAPA